MRSETRFRAVEHFQGAREHFQGAREHFQSAREHFQSAIAHRAELLQPNPENLTSAAIGIFLPQMRSGNLKFMGLIAGLLLPLALFGQAPSLSLEVKPVASGGKVESSSNAAISRTYTPGYSGTLQSESYSSSRTRSSQTELAVTIRNFGRTPQNVVVESFFFGKPVGAGDIFPLNVATADRALAAGSVAQVSSESKVATNYTDRAFSQRTESSNSSLATRTGATSATAAGGSKVYGWIVRVLVDGKTIQSRASNPTLEQVAKSQVKMDDFRAQAASMAGPPNPGPAGMRTLRQGVPPPLVR